MAKNILVFSDGTRQEGGRGSNSNVYKLFNMVEHRTDRQIAFYDRGVGIGRYPVFGSIGGLGLGRNVKECYRFISDNFHAGDRIFLFGFSRGAATMRSLSYFIHLFGMLPQARPELIEQAWRIYRGAKGAKREQEAAAFLQRHHTMWAKVHFLGCYDTVAALGLPTATGSFITDKIPFYKHSFHNFDLSPSVVHAYHAIALDDERLTFHPLLWNPEKPPACETLRQVWFAGMHCDVGGGYDRHGLSDLALVWMTSMAVAKGLHIYPQHDVDILEEPDGHMHDSRAGKWRFYRRRVRAWDAGRADRPVVHASVMSRTKDRRNLIGAGYAAPLDLSACDIEPWVPYGEQPWRAQRGPTPRVAAELEPPAPVSPGG